MKKMIFLLAITFVCILTLTTGCNKMQPSPTTTIDNSVNVDEPAATKDISIASPATETVTSTETAESEPASKPWWSAPTASIVEALRGGREIENRPTVKGSTGTTETVIKLAAPWNIPKDAWIVEIDETMTESATVSGIGGKKEISLTESIQSGVREHFANPEIGDSFEGLVKSCGRQMTALQSTLGPYETSYGVSTISQTVLVACTQPQDWKDIEVEIKVATETQPAEIKTEKIALIICDKKGNLNPGDVAVAWRFDKKKSDMSGRTDGWYIGVVTYSEFQPTEGHDYWPPEEAVVVWNYVQALITAGPPKDENPRLYDTCGTWQSFPKTVKLPS